jgi:hypothetical protein
VDETCLPKKILESNIIGMRSERKPRKRCVSAVERDRDSVRVRKSEEEFVRGEFGGVIKGDTRHKLRL